MAISITRARARESSAIEKAKKSALSNSEITPRSIKECTKPATRSSSNDHKAKTLSERQIPSYVKPKASTRSGSQSQSLKAATQKPKPSVNRKPASPSISHNSKAKEVSSSRPHKAIVPPGPPHRTPLRRTSCNPTPTPPKTTTSPKPISKITSQTPRAAKPKPLSSKKGSNTKKTVPATKKKVADALVNSTNTPECSDAAADTSRPEAVPSVTEQESGVFKAEDDEYQEVEKVSEIPPQEVEKVSEVSAHVNEAEPNQTQIQAYDVGAIPSVPEGEPVTVAEVEEAKGELEEEKTKDEGTSQGESNNWRNPEEQTATDGDFEVKEKEKEGGVIKDEESENNNEGKIMKENEGGETIINEDKTNDNELVPKTEVEEVKTDSTPPKEEEGKESQAYVNVIEETASKLPETRKNKVKALAGAFQSVIDNQTSSN